MSAVASLWPEINVDIVPPATVLRVQAAALGRLTKGILEGEVISVEGDHDDLIHRLDLIAPLAGDRRESILTVTHREKFYPLLLEADCFREPNVLARATKALVQQQVGLTAHPTWPRPKDGEVVVADYDDFLKQLGEVLKSGPVRSVIDSLLALSNERAAERGEPTEPAA